MPAKWQLRTSTRRRILPCMVIELRQYRCHPGRRDALIELFERELLDTQEAVGIRVLGQFHDLDRPDHFVWLRGFRDLAARAPALHAFYDGPVWRAHRDAANATMLDSDDVLLLRPLHPGSDLPPPRPGAGAEIVATICDRAPGPDAEVVRGFEAALAPFAALE